jgi:hypothetical protein
VKTNQNKENKFNKKLASNFINFNLDHICPVKLKDEDKIHPPGLFYLT